MKIDPSAIQLVDLAAGLLAALVGLVAARGRLRSLDLAAVAVAAYLAWDDQLRWGALVVVAAAMAIGFVPSRKVRLVAAVGLGWGAAVAATNPSGWGVALLVAGVGAAVLATPRTPPASTAPAALGIAGALVATAFGGPDTEAAFAALGALVLPAALDRRLLARGIGLAAPALVALIAVDAYRGRPGGLPAATVALAALGLGLALSASSRPRRTVLLVAAGGAVLAPVAARAIGLDPTASALDVAWAVAAVVAALAGTRWALSGTGGARTPPT